MFPIIELEDSDDECQSIDVAASSSLNTFTTIESKTKHGNTIALSSNSLNNSHPDNKAGNFNVNIPQNNTFINYQPPGRHSRRKSMHNMIRSSEMEFAMLPTVTELKTQKVNEVSSNRDETFGNKKTKKSKNQPNILLKGPTPGELFNADFKNFISQNKTKALIKEIAMERLRINTLLKLIGMPEIHFNLYTEGDQLRSQIEDRFNQRKMRQQIELKKSQ